MKDAKYFAHKYAMQPHPEGGWYKETYRANEQTEAAHLPPRFGGKRNFSTAIYFMLEAHHFSAFHRIKSDEVWHFYEGGPLNVYVINAQGNLEIIKLGRNPDEGEVFQAVVMAGCWFASRPCKGTAFCLVGCTVAPGFDFADFELAKGVELSQQYPAHNELIRELCRQ